MTTVAKYNINAQVVAMQGLFPRFKCKRGKGDTLVFKGLLFIAPEYEEYLVSVTYSVNVAPQVRILEPQLVPNAPHLNSDGTLCLYRPELFEWKKTILVTEIMGWVASWIYFYELWKECERWLGPEAPHGPLTSNEENTTPTNN